VDTHFDPVTIRSFSSESEAVVAKSALEAFGIDCFLSSDDCGGQERQFTMVNGIRLAVRSEDAERAQDVLANATAESN
jgi:hypothetical protein